MHLTRLRLPLILTACMPIMAMASNQQANITQISADKTTYDHPHQQVIFTGHVVATQPDRQIRGERLVLHFDDQRHLIRMHCTGHPAFYQQQLSSAPHTITGQAEAIDYNLMQQRTEFTGHAHITRGQHQLSGPQVTVFNQDHTVITRGNQRQKTRLILQPDALEAAT